MTPAAGKAQASRIEWGLALGGCGLVLGLGFPAQWSYLWWRWTSSGLRSIGMLLPLAAAVLVWRAWKRATPGAGSFWGLLILLAALAGARWWQLPTGLLIWAGVGGLVIWLRGWRDWRRAWFGLGLLLLLNPVPMFLSASVDVRLQNGAVWLAQALASVLGMHPVRQSFALRFSNHQTMYLANQCDGLRSAVALFYIGLIAGYWRGLAWMRWLAMTAAGVALAYGLNALRLSGMVLFHLAAGHWLALNPYENVADHLWGGLLFFLGATGFLLVLRLQPAPVKPLAAGAAAGAAE